MFTPAFKQQVIERLLLELNNSLQSAELAAKSAHDLATHEQSKPETQYDTVGLEAAFLAEGQSQRVTQLQKEIADWQQLISCPSTNDIQSGSLIELTDETFSTRYFLLGRTSGGMTLTLAPLKVTVISHQSPMGKALLGKQIDDDVSLTVSEKTHVYEVSNIV